MIKTMNTNENTTANAATTINLQVDWNIQDNYETKAQLEALIRDEIASLVADGIYPADLKFVGLVNNFDRKEIEVSVESKESAVDFYTHYVGGDRDHAIAELQEYYDLEI